ncbi:MAG: hypothetical protein SFX73_08790 [Kofleriaceae bacterium]|nr:hypothetical protein [Kofleriaceae bacterium]
MRRVLSAVVLAGVSLAALSCGETTATPINQLVFDRPIDVGFACYGGLRLTNGGPATKDQDVTLTAQPLAACTIRSGAAVDGVRPVPPGQESLVSEGGLPVSGADWYGFILNSSPGTVSLAKWDTRPPSDATLNLNIVDADPLTPGMNGISVGEDPIAISGDRVGCFQVVANAGSCDLSTLEVNTALDYDFDPAVNVNRVAIKNANQQVLAARPSAMVFEPPGGTIGAACPATATGVAYLAYPSCHLVAAVDVSTGTIVGGIQYDAAGVPAKLEGAALAGVTCPAECGGGGTITPGTRPVTLDLEKDPRTDAITLAIGADNSHSVTIVELGSDALPVSHRQVAFEDPTNDLGVTYVALSPQIGAGGQNGSINDDIASSQFTFLYAITTDDTIRVADILSINARECDTQVDPRLVEKLTDVRQMSCFPVGAPETPARRPGARGPGIELPGDAVPTSIEIFRSESPNGDVVDKWIGYFGIISSTSGQTFVLNVDDDNYPDLEDAGAPLVVWTPLNLAHQLRDAIEQRSLLSIDEQDSVAVPICDNLGPDPDSGGNIGGPRAVEPPTRSVPSGVISAEKAPALPTIRQVLCVGEDTTMPVSELGFAAPVPTRNAVYRDLRVLRDENWTATWEGALSLDGSSNDTDGPPVRISQMVVDAGGMRLVDQSQPFCDAGVEDFDIVQFRGCDPSLGDAQCPVGYTCYVHPNSQISGLGACMLNDEADRLADACKDFLTSLRRYTVARSASGELRLAPRKSILATTPVDGCVDDNQCNALADYSARLNSSANPIDMTTENPRNFRCLADPERAPLDAPGATGKRCVETCTAESACSTGRICRIPAGATEGMCYEGVVPPQACVNAPQRYEVRAHEAFTFIGSRSGYVHGIIRDPNSDRCVRDPNAHPFDIGRIPLTAPACDPSADPLTGRLPDGTFEANPCSLTVDHTEYVPNYVDNATCALGDPTTKQITRQAEAIQFRNRGLNLTLVDPTYPGDAQCIRDRMGTLGKVPLAFSGYQIGWRQWGGFSPLTLSTSGASFPIRVVRGPTDSIWVIDQGDFISTSSSVPSTRGKVFRVDPINPGTTITLQ